MNSLFSYIKVHVLPNYYLCVCTLPQAVRMCAWFNKKLCVHVRYAAYIRMLYVAVCSIAPIKACIKSDASQTSKKCHCLMSLWPLQPQSYSHQVDPEDLFTKHERCGRGSFGEVFKG